MIKQYNIVSIANFCTMMDSVSATTYLEANLHCEDSGEEVVKIP